MPSEFDDLGKAILNSGDGLKRAAVHVAQAMQELVTTDKELRAAMVAALQANAEHEDLRDTVNRLEALVLKLVQQINERPQ